MKPYLPRLLLLALPLAASCTTYSEELFVGSDDYVIAANEAPDGSRESFVLDNGRSLQRMTYSKGQRGFLGFSVAELDKDRAEQRGVRPYTGLLVTGTFPESAARLAGVRANDVLLTVDGRELIYHDQLREVEGGLSEGQQVRCTLLRGDETVTLDVEARMVDDPVSKVEGIPLDAAPRSDRPYAGVTMRGIPADWCERIFGEPCNAIVLTDVGLGSPAWVAGFRSGDILRRVDGQPVPPVAELTRRIQIAGPNGAEMIWSVQREAGVTYENAIALDDYSGTTRFHVPLLWSSRNSADEDRWSIGWGLVMGNRNEYVPDNATRQLESRNRFSALLGLFRVDSGPDTTRIRLLWLISFET